MSVDQDHLDKLKQLKAEYEADHADVEADLAQLEQKRDRLERTCQELRQLIEGIDGVLSRFGDGNKLPQAAAVAPLRAEYENGSTPSRESSPSTNGSSKGLSRRQIVLQIVPRFHGGTFSTSDIREKFVEHYLGGVEPPNFPQAVNNLLKRMADKGEIKSLGQVDGKYLYQENMNREESLNLGP